jgi:hypothetical protein
MKGTSIKRFTGKYGLMQQKGFDLYYIKEEKKMDMTGRSYYHYRCHLINRSKTFFHIDVPPRKKPVPYNKGVIFYLHTLEEVFSLNLAKKWKSENFMQSPIDTMPMSMVK